MKISTISDKKNKFTLNDYLATNEGDKIELIEGEFVEMTSPNAEHQTILGNLYIVIRTFIDKNNLGKIFMAFFDVIFNDTNVFQPDLIYISKENLEILKEKIYGTPDLIII